MVSRRANSYPHLQAGSVQTRLGLARRELQRLESFLHPTWRCKVLHWEAPMRLLLVEDDVSIQQFLKRTLVEAGYQVDAASTAKFPTVELWQQRPPGHREFGRHRHCTVYALCQSNDWPNLGFCLRERSDFLRWNPVN